MDLVLALHVYYRSHNIPYSMKYSSDAVCWTQAPFMELAGFTVILVAVILRCLNIQFAILITLLYLCFSILQTILFYVSKCFLRGDKYYKGDFWWCVYMCFADIIFFRPILFFVRLSAFVGYKKNLHSWHKLEREEFGGEQET